MSAERIASRFGINTFATAEDAKGDALETLRHGAPFWVFRLTDGTFLWSAISEPESPLLPYWDGATLVLSDPDPNRVADEGRHYPIPSVHGDET